MPKKYLPMAIAAAVWILAGIGFTVVMRIRRTRQELPPVSPTVPRVDEYTRAVGDATGE